MPEFDPASAQRSHPEDDPGMEAFWASFNAHNERRRQWAEALRPQLPEALRTALVDPAIRRGVDAFRGRMADERQQDQGRRPYYEGVGESGMYIAVDERDAGGGEEGLAMVMYAGPLQAFRDEAFSPGLLPVQGAERARDGGTTDIRVENGRFQKLPEADGGHMIWYDGQGGHEIIYPLPQDLQTLMSSAERANSARQVIQVQPDQGQHDTPKQGLWRRFRRK